MRAARTGGDQVDVALAHRRSVFGKRHAAGHALALGEVVALAIGEAIGLEQRDHRVAVERLHQVVAQAALVEPGLDFLGFLDRQRHRHARHQHGLAAQQVRQLVDGQSAGFKVFGIRPDPHRRALFAVTFGTSTTGSRGQRLNHIATREDKARALPLPVAGGL